MITEEKFSTDFTRNYSTHAVFGLVMGIESKNLILMLFRQYLTKFKNLKYFLNLVKYWQDNIKMKFLFPILDFHH